MLSLQRQYQRVQRETRQGPITELQPRGILVKGELPEIHHLSTKVVKEGLQNGWISLDEQTLTIHCVKTGDHRYHINRVPGRYCLHDGVKLPDDPTGIAARAYIDEHYPGVESPDPAEPSGYTCINYYDLELEA